ncbi:MAG TPA: ABC transporter substrate-binding protein, partial [Polyangiaceae bacterium]|nr:ABC transporter substrate-binding protein [Polyangiaceae bacterium]
MRSAPLAPHFVAHLVAAALAVGAVVAAACASPELEGTNWACAERDECGPGYSCALDGAAVGRCVPSDAAGPIRLGMSAPFQGPNGDLGTEMRRGMRAYFERVNAAGGVRGRRLVLDSRDDGYDPSLARQNTLALLDVRQEVEDADRPDVVGPDGVLALVGNVGTPTALAAAPLATKNHTIFFAPFTGANEYLRDGTKSPYVFNYRASYYEETAAMADFLFRVRSPRIAGYENVIAFVQNDAFGEAGYSGFSNAYNAIAPLPNPQAIARVTYERDNPVASTEERAVPDTLARLQALLPPPPAEGAPPPAPVSVAVVMVDTYSAGATFIRRVKDWVNGDARRALGLDVV